jgi:hypothetical protein
MHRSAAVAFRLPAHSAVAAAVALAALAALAAPPAAAADEVVVSYAAEATPGPIDGRVLVVFSTSEEGEPRSEIEWDVTATMQIFGADAEALAPGGEVRIGGDTLGHPVERLAEVPAGRYRVQAVLHRYETFHRADGHTVKLPMDRGEGQHWDRAPGNLYSVPQAIDFDPGGEAVHRVVLDQVISPIEPPADTEYVRHVTIESRLLSDFWGRPMHLGAHVLLPEGFDDHPEARYPLMVFHGHFPADFGGFRTEPPDPDLPCQPSERFGLDCYNRTVQQESYDFYKRWTSPDFPRFLIIEIQHANPYYDDSYAVNSANLGPYGDAITYELIPAIEERFRGIGEGWARFLYGGSTGGWEALAAQVFYPDDYNGAFAACPDPIDFRAYTQVDIYDDDNAYTKSDGGSLLPGGRVSCGALGHQESERRNRVPETRFPWKRSVSGSPGDFMEPEGSELHAGVDCSGGIPDGVPVVP